MDWRFVVAGIVVAVGLGVGWLDSGTVGGAVVAAGLFSAVFVIGWLVDKYVYDL